MKRQLFLLLTLLIFSLYCQAQKVETVYGEYTYVVPDNVSKAEARDIAIERAKIQAIADKFGTTVSQNNATVVTNIDGKANVDFSSIGATDVRGEWIETQGEPEVVNATTPEGRWTITVKIKGKAREIVSAKVDIVAKVLCNGTEAKFENDKFKEGDDLYLLFSSPVKGCVAVYLMDDSQTAYCLLPYRGDSDGMQPVEAGKSYVFFSTEQAPDADKAFVDTYYMTCEKSAENNRLFIIFSPNQFTKANDEATDNTTLVLPRQLAYKDFNAWLAKNRNKDKDMQVIEKVITIEKK
jgi:hypothetical protein